MLVMLQETFRGMKRNLIINIVVFCIAFGFITGCDKSITAECGGYIPIRFNTSIVQGEETKTPGVSGTQFAFDIYRYDNVNMRSAYNFALWICNAGGITPHMTGMTNMECLYYAYQSGSSSLLIPSSNTSQTQQTYAKIGKGIDIYSFYPYVSCSDPHSVPFTTSEQKDWMWGEPVSYTPEQTEAAAATGYITTNLKFHHAMTCVEIWLDCRFPTAVDLTSITLTDSKGKLVSKGTMDGTTGELSGFTNVSSIKISGNNSYTNRLTNVEETGGRWQKYSFLMPEYSGFDGTNLVLSFVFDTNAAGRNTYTLSNKLIDEATGNEITIDTFETGCRYVYQLRLDNTLLIEPLHMFKPTWTTEEHTFSM